ncbi:MAG: Hsp20/alpha crystallin family protein [Neisseriaceae bacterium]
MNLTTYDPWKLINQINDMLDSSLRKQDSSTTATSIWAPAVDINEDKDNYYIKADLPGVNKDDIEVFMDNGVLTIKGKREQETRTDNSQYSRVERICGTFHRQFTLPDIADSENIEANYEDGVLKLCIPKKEASKPKRISVMGSDKNQLASNSGTINANNAESSSINQSISQ